jgi:putative cardiolipin synthase
LPIELALPLGEVTALDHAILGEEAQHANQSAFQLVADGEDAFTSRAHIAEQAGRSLDIQTYIWHADLTGLYMAQVVLDAADRGVKVRLLLDDLDAQAKNTGLAALAAHPNIAVRVFNPFASRSAFLGNVGEWITNFRRINRRMHNKSWIADNRIAIVGGRNIGDEYFSASDEVNFIDLDFTMVGPVVRDVSATFDQYWNSASAYPMEILDPGGVTDAALDDLREGLRVNAVAVQNSSYARALAEDEAAYHLLHSGLPAQWSSHYQFVADTPNKISSEQVAAGTPVLAVIKAVLDTTERDAIVVSPYFVPGESGARYLGKLAAAGKQVRILTNSLAANDVAVVHGGYSRYRKTLLASGIQLWELKPLAGKTPSKRFGSSSASLHTKALSVDNRRLFVGSYNIDQRSALLNCEQGVMVEDEVLAEQFAKIFATQISGQNAWRVTSGENGLTWSDGVKTFSSDPQASAWRRFQAWIARILDMEEQL